MDDIGNSGVYRCELPAAGLYSIRAKHVEATTGKSIRKHLIEWWNEVYADLRRWLETHRHLKIARVAAVIASANIGCITHLQSGTPTPVKHWIELLDQCLGNA